MKGVAASSNLAVTLLFRAFSVQHRLSSRNLGGLDPFLVKMARPGVTGPRISRFRLHLERAAVQLRKSGNSIIQRQVDPMLGQVTLDKVRNLWVYWSQYLIRCRQFIVSLLAGGTS